MKYCLKRQDYDERDFLFSTLIGAITVPTSIDMRKLMPPIYDQLQLGSCSANSSTSYDVFLHGNKIQLSRLFEYYMVRKIEGTVDEDSGATNRDNVNSIKKSGICEENLMPYDISKFTIPPIDEAISNAKQYTISSYVALNNLSNIKQALAMLKPVIVGMDVFESLEGNEIAQTGKMSMPLITEQNLGGHSVLVVGYVDAIKTSLKTSIYNFITRKVPTKGYLIVRNSWGVGWGDKGYFYMPYEYLPKYTFDYWTMNK
ncbi:MAG TPA: C1 family peptidase [Clostridiaceae bacterium]